MRIAFDGTALRPGRTGVGYYTEHLLHHLAQTATNDELIVVSNRAIDTTSPLPSRVRVATPARRVPRLVWMQTLAVTALREVEADVVHFTNGMVPLIVAGADRRDDPRHEPAALSPLPSAAARDPQPSAGRSRRATGRRDHHAVGERQARHRPPVQPRPESGARRLRGGGAVVHAGARPGGARAGAPALRARRTNHSLRRDDRAAEEPADA